MASLYNVGSPSKDERWNHGNLALTSGRMFFVWSTSMAIEIGNEWYEIRQMRKKGNPVDIWNWS